MVEKVRRVTVKVSTKDGQDDRAVPTFVEVDRGSGPIRMSGKDLVCNSKNEETFDLRPGERLVIEGFTQEAIAYDKEQAAAFRPDTQQNNEGKTDAAKPDAPKKDDKPEQTSQSGAKPGETQDSRLKSSPGTQVTGAMASTPGTNTGAPASTPGGAQIAGSAAKPK